MDPFQIRVLSGSLIILGLLIGSLWTLRRRARSPRQNAAGDRPTDGDDNDAATGSTSGASTNGDGVVGATGGFVFGDERDDGRENVINDSDDDGEGDD